jgi:2-polyprenyl-3-methyl-5-hydroxy-6-metoxy-1,4-benzoquinol methylase
MPVSYDKYYQTINLFGEPYPELIDFLTNYPKKGKLLDLGCGQGRDAIALAKLGYEVLGVDYSKVGIDQMNTIAKAENLKLQGIVTDIYKLESYDEFDIILLDSMFHFTKKDKLKEGALIQKIIAQIKQGSIMVVCIQDIRNKVQILNEFIVDDKTLKRLVDKKFNYSFEDSESGHQSLTPYHMIVIEKQ